MATNSQDYSEPPVIIPAISNCWASKQVCHAQCIHMDGWARHVTPAFRNIKSIISPPVQIDSNFTRPAHWFLCSFWADFVAFRRKLCSSWESHFQLPHPGKMLGGARALPRAQKATALRAQTAEKNPNPALAGDDSHFLRGPSASPFWTMGRDTLCSEATSGRI